MTDPTASEPTDHSRPRVLRPTVLCGTGLALGVVAAYVFLGLTPSLLAHHAVLLEALNGSNVAMVTGGALARVGRSSLILVVVAPLVSIAIYDVFYWWAGRLWGGRIAQLYSRNSPRTARHIDRAEAFVRRRGVLALPMAYFLPIPNVFVYLFCGTSGMPLWQFVLGDAVGTVLWSGLLAGLGWSAGRSAVHVVDTVQHYAIPVTIGLIVVAAAVSAYRRRRSAPAETLSA